MLGIICGTGCNEVWRGWWGGVLVTGRFPIFVAGPARASTAVLGAGGVARAGRPVSLCAPPFQPLERPPVRRAPFSLAHGGARPQPSRQPPLNPRLAGWLLWLAGFVPAVRGRLLLKCFMDVSTTPALLALTRQQVFELFFQGPVMKKQFKNSLAGLGYRVSDMRFAVRRFWRRWFGRFVWGLCFRSAWRFSVALEVRWLVQSFCQSGAFPVVAVLGSVGLVAALVRWLPGPWWLQFGVAVVGSLRAAWFLVRRL